MVDFETVVRVSTIAAALSGWGITILSLYLLHSNFERRAVWKDDATMRGKIRTHAKYAYNHANWSELPKIIGVGAVIGFVSVFVTILLVVGLIEVLT